ncbi:MAG TPA: flap endonuclease-1 [Candidatus Nanoarchaeia archaeon]|nr:flap endonuclease-1 [Candidatus Nanoarchaeia archaeon]
MGVNISELLPKKEISFNDLNNKIIAIDAFNVLYQFLSSIRQYDGTPLMDTQGNITSHLQGLLSRTINLMNKNIKIIYIFDGIAPKLKERERELRKEQKLKGYNKYLEASQEKDIKNMLKYAKTTSRLTKEMTEEAKELIKALGLPIIEAPSEAEAQAAFMCKNKDVYATASQDADSLLFGTPILIRNLTLSQKRKTVYGKIIYTFLEEIKLEDTLKSLEINYDQLITLGILVGTDFNPGGIKGIGPKKALKLIKTQSPEEIFKEADFNWREIYNIFTKIPVTKDYKLKWNPIDEKKLKEILIEKHDFSKERIDILLNKSKNLLKKEQNNLSGFFNN